MNRKRVFATICLFSLCTAGIAVFAFWPFSEKKTQEQYRTRLIIPGSPGESGPDTSHSEYLAYEDSYSLKAPLGEGEIAVTVLNYDFDNDSIEEQIVAFRNLNETGNPIAVTLLSYDENDRAYRRLWTSPSAATMPGTVTLYIQDLLGDRSSCVIVMGMNSQGEHTLTVLNISSGEGQKRFFSKIAELRIDGSISIEETERSLAYRQGIARGQPFGIVTFIRDSESENMLDRVEITYAYNQESGVYERNKVTRVPGSQIEQRRLREILNGDAKVFEGFINDLWYYVSPNGTVDKSQYLYFDPAKREIIFYGDDTQQVFNWQHSSSTRYGLYISSQNISVTTLRRFLDLEIESLDSIRMRVFEDVKLKIGVGASWDGTYRRAGTAARIAGDEKPARPYTDAVYDSSMGRLRFYASGEYELSSSGALTKGRYAFFRTGGRDLLELRPDRNGAPAARQQAAKGENDGGRQIFYISALGGAESGYDEDGSADSGSADNGGAETGGDETGALKNENLSLSRVRLGASGVYELNESQIILTRAR